MVWIFGVFLVPIIIGAIWRSGWWERDNKGEERKLVRSITWWELIIIEVVAIAVACAGLLYNPDAETSTEHLNGTVTSKSSDTSSCCHCYTKCDTCHGDHPCNCREVSEATSTACSTDHDCFPDDCSGGYCTTTTTKCDTCNGPYECNCRPYCPHDSHFKGVLGFSNGENRGFGTCSKGPIKDWNDAQIGDLASFENSYTNHLLSISSNLLPTGGDVYISEIPDFPEIVGFKVKKVLLADAFVSSEREWSAGIEKINADLGSKKQVDLMVVFTPSQDPLWADALARKWRLGPKNALIIVIGVDDEIVKWLELVSISDVGFLEERFRKGLVGTPLSKHAQALDLIRAGVEEDFERTPMATFSYLTVWAPPPWWLLLLIYLAAALTSALLCMVFGMNALLEDEKRKPLALGLLTIAPTVLILILCVIIFSIIWAQSATILEEELVSHHAAGKAAETQLWQEVRGDLDLGTSHQRSDFETMLGAIMGDAQPSREKINEALDGFLDRGQNPKTRAQLFEIINAHRESLVRQASGLKDRQEKLASHLNSPEAAVLNLLGLFPHQLDDTSHSTPVDRDGDGNNTGFDLTLNATDWPKPNPNLFYISEVNDTK